MTGRTGKLGVVHKECVPLGIYFWVSIIVGLRKRLNISGLLSVLPALAAKLSF